jgi:hypothetical protein
MRISHQLSGCGSLSIVAHLTQEDPRMRPGRLSLFSPPE